MMPLTSPTYMVNFPVEIILKNNQLYLHAAWGPDIKLIPESGKKFFYENDTDQQIEFDNVAVSNEFKTYYIGYGVRKEIHKIE